MYKENEKIKKKRNKLLHLNLTNLSLYKDLEMFQTLVRL